MKIQIKLEEDNYNQTEHTLEVSDEEDFEYRWVAVIFKGITYAVNKEELRKFSKMILDF